MTRLFALAAAGVPVIESAFLISGYCMFVDRNPWGSLPKIFVAKERPRSRPARKGARCQTRKSKSAGKKAYYDWKKRPNEPFGVEGFMEMVKRARREDA